MIEEFLLIQLRIRMYHWTTKIYNQHVVSGKLYEKIDSLIDKFIETYSGERKFKFTPVQLSVTDNELMTHLNQFKQYLMGDLELLIGKNNDLKNIRDDILGELNRAIYLLNLK